MPQPDLLTNQPELTVTELSGALKRTLEEAFGYVRVRGEISGYKHAPSGHAYFNLKDENAVLAAVCWKGSVSRLPFKPEDGVEVLCLGRVTTYAGQSKYQLIVEAMEPAGMGALMALLEKRKAQLAAEGLFDISRKRPLPFLPEVIGVVTSPTGAVIRDILHRISERFPRRVLLWPVLVQGEQAAAQIAAAVKGFNQIRPGSTIPKPDVLIIARGGGSLEDLWPFNEEMVIRAVAASEIPVISAVGHETDTTLIDFVADKRAPTPTAAAEMAVPVRADWYASVMETGTRLSTALLRQLKEAHTRMEGLARGLPRPQQWLEHITQQLDMASERLMASPTRILDTLEHRLQLLARLLESFHYKKVLERGFALVRDDKQNLVTAASQTTSGQRLTLEFHDGIRKAVAEGGSVKRHEKKALEDRQEKLF